MKPGDVSSAGAAGRDRLATAGPSPPPGTGAPAAAEVRPAGPEARPGGVPIPFDPWRLLLACWGGRWLVLITAVAGSLPLLAFGWWRFETTYTATVQLIRRELPNSFRVSDLGEAFKPRQLSVATIVSIMRSPNLLARVGAQGEPRTSAGELLGGLVITPEKNTDLITVTLRGRSSREATAGLINRYATGVVELTRSLQQQEAAELDRFLRAQLSKAERELATVNGELLAFSRDNQFYNAEKEIEAYLRELGSAEAALTTARLEQETVGFRIAGLERELARLNPAALRLAGEREKLDAYLERYTDSNPLVIEQREKVAALERAIASTTNAVPEFQPGSSSLIDSMYGDLVSLQARQEALKQQEAPLEERLGIIRTRLAALPDKEMRYAALKARQQSLELARNLLAGRQREAQLFTEDSPGYYRLFAPAEPREVAISSKGRKLGIVAVAGAFLGAALALLIVVVRLLLDPRIISPSDMRRAARAPQVARLGNLAALSPDALARWRFATWSALFRAHGDPARRSLLLGLLAAAPGQGCSTWARQLARAATERGFHSLLVTNDPGPDAPAPALGLEAALDDPAAVLRQLETAGQVTVVWPRDIPWSAARRNRWSRALETWSSVPGVAILAELPPASDLEAVLLAETLPGLLWVSRSGTTTQDQVASAIEMLATSEARVVGVLANEVPAVFERLPDLARYGLLLALGLGLGRGGGLSLPLAAQEPAPAASVAAGSLSATSLGPRLAPWQQRLTLGPGDQVNLAVYGRKDLTRAGVPIGPDGRISYLQVHDVKAAGLTIDELREELSAGLAAHLRHARVIVTPAAFRSKRYYLLGTVIDRGAYPLDRPLTIIEAIARARGIATGLLEQNTVEIADLARAFLVRQGRRMPVDFVKLFQEGDLSQNIPLEPEDYIYFPSSTLNEVYLLGSIASPGTVGVTDRSTLVGVLTTRGGFTDKAYRQRVLVVRGSLNQPETFAVNVADILRGKAPDFALLPKDIVYVSDRPWARVEELLDIAVKAFITTAVSTWTSQNMGLIEEPFVPALP